MHRPSRTPWPGHPNTRWGSSWQSPRNTKFSRKSLDLLVDYVLLISAFLFNHPFSEQYNVSISSWCDTLAVSYCISSLWLIFFSSEYIFPLKLWLCSQQIMMQESQQAAWLGSQSDNLQPPPSPFISIRAVHLTEICPSFSPCLFELNCYTIGRSHDVMPLIKFSVQILE